MLELLVEHGADLEARTKNNETPLGDFWVYIYYLKITHIGTPVVHRVPFQIACHLIMHHLHIAKPLFSFPISISTYGIFLCSIRKGHALFMHIYSSPLKRRLLHFGAMAHQSKADTIDFPQCIFSPVIVFSNFEKTERTLMYGVVRAYTGGVRCVRETFGS